MSDITVRNIDFRFDDDIQFQWNPGNPEWGNFVNLITIIVPAFERYAIKSARAAIPHMKNERVAVDADLFCRQEAQHSKYHLRHLEVLTNKHPGLEKVAERVMSSYDSLYVSESLEFHLAYAAISELYLGPLARFMVDNREQLMPNADPRIASFILWHFIEEFEHKNAAIDIYNEVVGSYWYRIKSFPKIAKHLNQVKDMVLEGFDIYVAREEGAPKNSAISNMFNGISFGRKMEVYYEWLCTLLPYHNPNRIREPEWLVQWHRDYNNGVDMTRYFPGLGA